jgi:hypothetical protein
MRRHFPEIVGATALSSLFSLFSSAFAAKALGLAPGGVGRAPGGGGVRSLGGGGAERGCVDGLQEGQVQVMTGGADDAPASRRPL